MNAKGVLLFLPHSHNRLWLITPPRNHGRVILMYLHQYFFYIDFLSNSTIGYKIYPSVKINKSSFFTYVLWWIVIMTLSILFNSIRMETERGENVNQNASIEPICVWKKFQEFRTWLTKLYVLFCIQSKLKLSGTSRIWKVCWI